jgi:hypothetical protein
MEQPNLIPLPIIPPVDGERCHLKNHGDRAYTFRIYITQGPKFCGKRISVSTGTKDIKLASEVVGLTTEALKDAGFIYEGFRFSKPELASDSTALKDEIEIIINEQRGQDDDMVEMLELAIERSENR